MKTPASSPLEAAVPAAQIPEGLDPLAEGVLMAHQRAWIEDKSTLKIAEKCRRSGFTFAEAFDDVLTAATAREEGGASGRAAGVVLSDGRFLRGDLILLAAGIRPRVELAASSGLALENGIRLDAHLLTSDSAISALGDCASYPDPRTGRQVRLESVQAATDHARSIAARLTGKPEPYSALPWFWSNQGAGKLQIAGFDDRAVLSSSDVFVLEGGDGLQAYRFRDGALAALETINAPGAHMAARKLLSRAEPVSRSALEASDWDVLRLARGV